MFQYLFIINKNNIKLDLRQLKQPVESMKLIASTRCIESLTSDQAACFSTIIKTENLDFFSLVNLIDKIYTKESKSTLNIVTNDECVDIICAQLRQYYNINGVSEKQIIPFCKKDVTKKILQERKIKVPNFQLFDQIEFNNSQEKYLDFLSSIIEFPLIAKPVDGTGSNGVTKITNKKEFLSWAESHKADANFEIEEYIDGDLLHCDSIIKSGEVIFMQAGYGSYPCMEIANGKNIGTYILLNDSDLYKQVRCFNQKVLSSLNPPDGTTHMEIFLKKNGELIFLEISARPPGGDIRWMYQQFNGVDIEEAHFKIRMGLDYPMQPSEIQGYSAFMYIPTRSGVVSKLMNLELESLVEQKWFIKKNEELVTASHLDVKKACLIRLFHRNPEIVKRDFYMLKDADVYEVSREISI